LIKPDLFSPNNPNLNPVDYAVWGRLQQMVYQRRQFTAINQLMQTIITEWGKLSQHLVDCGVAGLSASSRCKADILNMLM